MALSNGLVYYWDFENSYPGGPWIDRIAGLTLQQTGGTAVESTTGKFGNAPKWNKSGVTGETTTVPMTFDNITISMWIKPNLGYNQYWLKGGTPTPNFSIFGGGGGPATIGCTWATRERTSGYSHSRTFSLPVDGEWHHFVGIHDGTTARRDVWIDGVLVNHHSYQVGDLANAATIWTMSHGTSSIDQSYYDELAIWNRGLTPEEVLSLYNNGQGKTYNVVALGYGEQSTFKTQYMRIQIRN